MCLMVFETSSLLQAGGHQPTALSCPAPVPPTTRHAWMTLCSTSVRNMYTHMQAWTCLQGQLALGVGLVPVHHNGVSTHGRGRHDTANRRHHG